MGMVSENGPFLFEVGKNTMKINEYAWNKNAHIIYLESPAGVGFSQGKPESLETNDTMVAKDNYQALVKFFQRYESLKDNDFYLAGESYAGIYIPRLADEIISNNQQESAQERKINIKGLLIGNGCTHPTECYTAKYISRYQAEFRYTRGFIDTADYSQYVSSCVDIDEKSQACEQIQKKLYDGFYNTKANVYNVFDVCYPLQNSNSAYEEYFKKMEEGKPELGIFQHALRCSDTVGSMSIFNRN